MDFAFALSHREREPSRRNREAQAAPSLENAASDSTGEEAADAHVAQVTLDALFSSERERQFKINLLKILVELNEDQKSSARVNT